MGPGNAVEQGEGEEKLLVVPSTLNDNNNKVKEKGGRERRMGKDGEDREKWVCPNVSSSPYCLSSLLSPPSPNRACVLFILCVLTCACVPIACHGPSSRVRTAPHLERH